MKDGRQCSARRNVHHQHLLQNKNERKTKHSDKKEAIAIDFWGDALFREGCREHATKRQASETSADELALNSSRPSCSLVSFWPCDRVAGFMMVKCYAWHLVLWDNTIHPFPSGWSCCLPLPSHRPA